MTKPRIKTGNREEVTVLCRLNTGACATRGHVMLRHSLFCQVPPKGGATDISECPRFLAAVKPVCFQPSHTPKSCLEKPLPDVVERQGHHVARSAFDERTIGSQVSQIIDGGVAIHEVVARQSPCGAKAQPRRFDSTMFDRIRDMSRARGFLIRHAIHVLKVAPVGNRDRGSKKHSET